MTPNGLINIGTATLSATGTLIPKFVGGTGSIDTSGTDWLAVHLNFGGTATVIAEGSFDGANWSVLPTLSAGGALVAGATSNGIYFVQTSVPFTRLRVSAWTSGAVNLLGGNTDLADAPVVWTPAGSQPVTLTTPLTSTVTLAASTNAGFAKASAATLYEIDVFNGTAAPAYVKLFNKASAPTLGTDIPLQVIPVPAAGIQSINFGNLGLRLATGLAYAVTLNAADSDATALGTAGGHLNLNYV